MSSEIKKINDKLKEVSILAENSYKIVADPASYQFSLASISSVSQDRESADIYLTDKGLSKSNVQSLIPIQELNNQGHLVSGDIVLVAYTNNFQDVFILKKMRISTDSYLKSKDIKVTNRMNMGVLGV